MLQAAKSVNGSKGSVEQCSVPATAIELVKGLSRRRHDDLRFAMRRCRRQMSSVEVWNDNYRRLDESGEAH
jgi:hypothetical protein